MMSLFKIPVDAMTLIFEPSFWNNDSWHREMMSDVAYNFRLYMNEKFSAYSLLQTLKGINPQIAISLIFFILDNKYIPNQAIRPAELLAIGFAVKNLCNILNSSTTTIAPAPAAVGPRLLSDEKNTPRLSFSIY